MGALDPRLPTLCGRAGPTARPPSPPRRWLAGLLALVAATALGQMKVDAPIQDFHLSFFEPDGARSWEVEGRQARYVTADLLEIDGLLLRLYDPDRKNQLTHTIRGSQATLIPSRREASGREDITVQSDNFTMEGRDWTWLGRDNRIIVRQAARLTLRDPIAPLLK